MVIILDIRCWELAGYVNIYIKIPFLTGAPFLDWCELLFTLAIGCTNFLCSTASKLRVTTF